MKKSIAPLLIALVALSAGCRRNEKTPPGGVSKTETIAPAQAQPSPTGTEAMTQTVDIEDSRSEAEGGVLNNEATPPPAATTATRTTKAPPTNKKKH